MGGCRGTGCPGPTASGQPYLRLTTVRARPTSASVESYYAPECGAVCGGRILVLPFEFFPSEGLSFPAKFRFLDGYELDGERCGGDLDLGAGVFLPESLHLMGLEGPVLEHHGEVGGVEGVVGQAVFQALEGPPRDNAQLPLKLQFLGIGGLGLVHLSGWQAAKGHEASGARRLVKTIERAHPTTSVFSRRKASTSESLKCLRFPPGRT